MKKEIKIPKGYSFYSITKYDDKLVIKFDKNVETKKGVAVCVPIMAVLTGNN